MRDAPWFLLRNALLNNFQRLVGQGTALSGRDPGGHQRDAVAQRTRAHVPAHEPPPRGTKQSPGLRVPSPTKPHPSGAGDGALESFLARWAHAWLKSSPQPPGTMLTLSLIRTGIAPLDRCILTVPSGLLAPGHRVYPSACSTPGCPLSSAGSPLSSAGSPLPARKQRGQERPFPKLPGSESSRGCPHPRGGRMLLPGHPGLCQPLNSFRA